MIMSKKRYVIVEEIFKGEEYLVPDYQATPEEYGPETASWWDLRPPLYFSQKQMAEHYCKQNKHLKVKEV